MNIEKHIPDEPEDTLTEILDDVREPIDEGEKPSEKPQKQKQTRTYVMTEKRKLVFDRMIEARRVKAGKQKVNNFFKDKFLLIIIIIKLTIAKIVGYRLSILRCCVKNLVANTFL